MDYQINLVFDFGSLDTLNLNGKLVDSNGNILQTLTSGFINLGNGNYSRKTVIPSGFSGVFIAYDTADNTIDCPIGIDESDEPGFVNVTVADQSDISGSQYISNYDADTYFDTRFNSSLWSPTSDSDKTKLLCTATRMIDTLNFVGDKNDPNQQLEFPRGTDTIVPTPIRYACCEIAYALLSGFDPEYELRNLSNIQARFDNSTIAQNDRSFHEARINGIPSTVAWDFLRPFLRDGSTITLSRVD